jgi:hypothetical protein
MQDQIEIQQKTRDDLAKLADKSNALFEDAYDSAPVSNYLQSNPEVKRYVEALEKSDKAELWLKATACAALVGSAFGAGGRFAVATLASGIGAIYTKYSASCDIESAATNLKDAKYASLLDAGMRSNSGYDIALTAASLSCFAAPPVLGMMAGKIGSAAETLAYGTALGGTAGAFAMSKDTGLTPVRKAIVDLAIKHESPLPRRNVLGSGI